MSYTSKYTGPEIDSLLSSIGGINATKKVLWEGSITNAGDMATLSESMENYEYLVVESKYITDASINTVRQYPATILSVSQILDSYAEGGIICGPSYTNISSGGQVSIFFKSTGVNNLGIYKPITSNNNNSVEMTKVVGIKFAQSSVAGGSASNPIGAILPIMGTEAPQDYLVCDGRELQISEYKELADYFEKQFGDNGYFGGDGIKTFKLPDLRNEFLRGYGDLSGEIGIHQDATTHLNLFVGGDNVLILDTQSSAGMAINQDGDTGVDMTGNSRNYYYTDKTNQDDNSYGGIPTFYTSRPTNVAVLFCIKYTEGASGANVSENYSTEEQRIGTWIDGKPLYRKVYTFDITSTPTRSFTVIEKDFGLTKQMKRVDGNVYGKSGDWSATYCLGLYHYWKDTTDVFSFLPNVENNDLIVFTQWSVTQNFTVEAVVEYTKTTD